VGNFDRYRKFAAAVLTAGLMAAQTALPLDPVQHGWVAVALATVGAAAVYAVPNAPMPRVPRPGDIVMLAVDPSRPDGPEAVARVIDVELGPDGWELALHLLTSEIERDRTGYLLRETKRAAAGTYRAAWWPPAGGGGEADGGRHRED
jgi:hypothetical protein